MAQAGERQGYAGTASKRAAVADLKCVDNLSEARTETGISELDRVLGGGLVHGSVVLLGGDPGIGKSTLLLQLLSALQGTMSSLYVTGEESLQQIGMRAKRLGLAAEGMRCLTETCLEHVLAAVDKERPKLVVIDSIQTLYTTHLQSAPGSVAQVRESAASLVRFAKATGTAVILVGHVTKEGALAGPRVLEHMVDAVLYFEGDAGSRYRVVRAIKNRFGAVNELGVFAMLDTGLKPVANPSAMFLSGFQKDAAGSAVLATREGTRPLLVEIQALVDQSPLANPRRVSVGLEQNRLAMLLAVLHRHTGVAVFDQDVFVNAVGGLRIAETAADLAVLLAVLSSFRNQPLPTGMVLFGEVGLGGEVRPVQSGEERIREAQKHGFTRAVVPKANLPTRKSGLNMELTGVERIADLLDVLAGS